MNLWGNLDILRISSRSRWPLCSPTILTVSKTIWHTFITLWREGNAVLIKFLDNIFSLFQCSGDELFLAWFAYFANYIQSPSNTFTDTCVFKCFVWSRRISNVWSLAENNNCFNDSQTYFILLSNIALSNSCCCTHYDICYKYYILFHLMIMNDSWNHQILEGFKAHWPHIITTNE